MVGQLDDLDEVPSGLRPVGMKPFSSNVLAVGVVELVAVAVPLVDQVGAVGRAGPGCRGPGRRARSRAASSRRARRTRPGRPSGRSPGAGWSGRTRCCWRPPGPGRSGRTRSWRTACPGRSRRMGCPWVRAYRIASILPSIPRIPNPPGTSRPSTPARRRGAALPADLLGLDPADHHPGPVGDPGVVERLVDRLVRVAVLHVLADDGDGHLGSGWMIRSTSSRQSEMSSGSALGRAGGRSGRRARC